MPRAAACPHPRLNPKSPAFSTGNVVVAAVPLRAAQDLVSLRRHTRDVAEQFGLPDRAVRSLSAATYEAARLLLAHAESGTADISIGVSADLEISIRVSGAGSEPPPPGLCAALAALKAVVDRVSVEHSDTSLTVTLATDLPANGPRSTTQFRISDPAAPPVSPASETDLVEGIELHPDVYPPCDEDAGLPRIAYPIRQQPCGTPRRRRVVPA